MASLPLTTTQHCFDFFQRGVSATLQYWQAHTALETLDVTVLDREREGIVKAISLGFNFQEAWQTVREVVITFSPYMERRGQWGIWNRILRQAIDVAHRLEDLEGAVILSTLLARLLQRQSLSQASVAYYRRAIRLSRQIGHRFNEARACTNLGYYYIEQGYWVRAEVLCCHALHLFEQIDSNHGLAHTENHLGILYTRQHRWEKAQWHLERACAIWQRMDDAWGLMYGYMNLGLLYIEMARGDEALAWSEKALHQAKLTGEALEIGSIYLNIGVAYRLKQEPAKAESYHRQAETVFQRFSNTVGLAQVQDNLGLAYMDQGRWKEAGLHLEAALTAWHNQGNEYHEIQAMTYLIEFERIRGDWAAMAARLEETEKRLRQVAPNARYQHLQARLKNYRHSLTAHTMVQAVAK